MLSVNYNCLNDAKGLAGAVLQLFCFVFLPVVLFSPFSFTLRPSIFDSATVIYFRGLQLERAPAVYDPNFCHTFDPRLCYTINSVLKSLFSKRFHERWDLRTMTFSLEVFMYCICLLKLWRHISMPPLRLEPRSGPSSIVGCEDTLATLSNSSPNVWYGMCQWHWWDSELLHYCEQECITVSWRLLSDGFQEKLQTVECMQSPETGLRQSDLMYVAEYRSGNYGEAVKHAERGLKLAKGLQLGGYYVIAYETMLKRVKNL